MTEFPKTLAIHQERTKKYYTILFERIGIKPHIVMPGRFVFQEREYTCPVELTLRTLQGKWKVLILWHLRDNTLRYSELRRRLQKVTHKMLSKQLRELEADGLIHRAVYPVVPPKTEYSLTDEGCTLVPILIAMQQWGLRYKQPHAPPSLHMAPDRFD